MLAPWERYATRLDKTANSVDRPDRDRHRARTRAATVDRMQEIACALAGNTQQAAPAKALAESGHHPPRQDTSSRAERCLAAVALVSFGEVATIAVEESIVAPPAWVAEPGGAIASIEQAPVPPSAEEQGFGRSLTAA
jgi:hypothetical protein